MQSCWWLQGTPPIPPIEENQALLSRSRNENKCADAFAKRGIRQDQDFVVFDNPPPDVLFLMYFDNLSSMTSTVWLEPCYFYFK